MAIKFCSSCSTARNIEGGQIVSYKSSDGTTRTRWKCAHCLAKKSESIYSKGQNVVRPVIGSKSNAK